jgi:hypothetical protein
MATLQIPSSWRAADLAAALDIVAPGHRLRLVPEVLPAHRVRRPRPAKTAGIRHIDRRVEWAAKVRDLTGRTPATSDTRRRWPWQ